MDYNSQENSQCSINYSNSRLYKNSSMVIKFLEEAEANSTTKISLNKNNVDSFVLNEVVDEESYVVFDRLWSSPDQQAVLVAQWDALVKKMSNQELYYRFHLPQTNVTGIFYLCRLLRTNFVIRFRALELYERYLKMFSIKMTDYMKSCHQADLDNFLRRFESQILLRMCSCIIIASKLHSDTQVKALSLEKVSRLLHDQGLPYDAKAISRSELRVLEILDFKCHWVTPLELVEQLLSILNLQVESLKRAHYFSILLLEYCYLDLEKIRRLFKDSKQKTVSDGRLNIPLQCAAIVSAALFIVATEVKSDLHKIVAKSATQPEEDVNILAIIILDMLMGSS